MNEDAGAPQLDQYPTVREYIAAHEAFHDKRKPTTWQSLDRASRLADEAHRSVRLQIRRVRGQEPEDAEWQFRVWMDFQFLIVALWRLRTVATIAVEIEGPAGHVAKALADFDRRLPDLARMRHVAQHLDDYAVDHPTRRRQLKPSDNEPVGRRMLEVGSWDSDHFRWLRGTIEIAAADETAACLSQALYQARQEADPA